MGVATVHDSTRGVVVCVELFILFILYSCVLNTRMVSSTFFCDFVFVSSWTVGYAGRGGLVFVVVAGSRRKRSSGVCAEVAVLFCICGFMFLFFVFCEILSEGFVYPYVDEVGLLVAYPPPLQL